MNRRSTPTAARRKVRPAEVAAVPVSALIPEDTFHRARAAATAHSNTLAGESFTTGTTTYVRVNNRHFRIETEAPLAHAEALALVGRHSTWGGR